MKESVEPPSVFIEICFDGSIDPVFEGNLNTDHVTKVEAAIQIAYNDKYNDEYKKSGIKQLSSLPIEYYEASWTSFARESITVKYSYQISHDRLSNYRYQNGSEIYFAYCQDLPHPKK